MQTIRNQLKIKKRPKNSKTRKPKLSLTRRRVFRKNQAIKRRTATRVNSHQSQKKALLFLNQLKNIRRRVTIF
jgi:hypothetical protein